MGKINSFLTSPLTWGVFLSLLLSPLVYSPGLLVNSDGILYLYVAADIVQQGFSSAFTLYNWPFYSGLIALGHEISNLSYINVAFTLNNIFLATTTLIFITLLKILGGNKRVQWLGMVVFLTYLGIIDYRGDIFRDYGYWLGFLFQFYCFIQYAQKKRFIWSQLWALSAFFAGLFRIEGIAYLILMPLISFYLPAKSLGERFKSWLSFYTLPLFFGGAFLIYLSLDKVDTIYTLISTIKNLIQHHLSANPLENFKKFQNLILPKQAKDHSAFIILFSGLLAYFCVKLGMLLNILNTYCIYIGIHLKRVNGFALASIRRVWIAYLSIALLIPLTFLLIEFFLSSRYAMTACLLLLLIVPFGIDAILSQYIQKERHNITAKIILSLLAISAMFNVASLIYRQYLSVFISPKVQASVWIANHPSLKEGLCSSDAWLAFPLLQEKTNRAIYSPLSNHFGYPLEQCNHLIFFSKNTRASLLAMIKTDPSWQLIKVFGPTQDKRVIYIFTRSPASRSTPL